MSLVKGKVQATMKLPMLQNLIKRDPHSYKQEFLLQMNRYQSELEIFKLRPTLDSDRFTELAMFISHTCSCYKDYSQTFPQSIMVLIETNASVLHPEVRIKLMNALILMRNKNLIEPLMLINLSFRLFAIPDKSLRSTLKEYILNDIKTINSKRNDEKVNKSIQAFLYTVVSEDASIRAKKGIEILAELYRRRIWNDARTVNVVGEACLNPSPKIFVPAIRFFLGIENSMEEDEEEQSAVTREVNTHEHSKKTKKRLRVEQKQKSINEKKMKQHMQKLEEAVPLFPAIQVIHDPHSMAEKLFKKARQSGERFEVKLLLMNFISRLIGCHKLLVLGFYSFLQRYLTAHQKDVTQILAYLIQACHELIPPEDVLPIVKAIAYNFISERCTNEVIAVGINSVREIIRRVPAILKEDGMDDFIQDLAMYGKKTHKSVMIAAHGLINLIRELYPSLLRKGERGKFHNINAQPADYGKELVMDRVDGIDLLQAYEDGEVSIDSNDDVIWKTNDDGSEDVDEENSQSEESCSGSDSEEFMDNELLDADDDDQSEMFGDEDEDEDEEGEEDEADEDYEEDEGEDKQPKKKVRFNSDMKVGAQTNVKETKSIRNRLDATRVLTEDDFKLIAKLKAAKAEQLKDPKFRSKKNATENNLDDEQADSAISTYTIDPSTLAAGVKTEKETKIERIKHMLANKTENKFVHEGHKGGLTNKEKLRKKNYVMVRKGKRSVANKSRKSNSTLRYEKLHKKKDPFGRDKRKRRRT